MYVHASSALRVLVRGYWPKRSPFHQNSAQASASYDASSSARATLFSLCFESIWKEVPQGVNNEMVGVACAQL